MAEGGSSQDPRPSAGHSRSSRAVVVPVLLILGIVVPTALYLMYVRPPQRERYFIDSRVRDLAVLSEQTEGALQAPLDALRAAAWRGEDWQAAVRQIGLEPVDWGLCKPTARGASFKVQNATRSCPTPNPGAQADPDAGLGLHVVIDAASKDTPSTAATEWGNLPASASAPKMGATLYFRKDCADNLGESAGLPAGSPITLTPTPTSPTPPTPAPSAKQPTQVKVCGQARLAKLVDPLITGTDIDGFDVFVADSDGTILLERGPTGIGVTRLPPETPSSVPTVGANDKCPNAVQGLPAIGDLNASSTVRNVIVSGTCYTLIAQPLRPPRLAPETPSDDPANGRVTNKGATDKSVASDVVTNHAATANGAWVIGVLIPKNLLEAEARAFSFGSWTSLPLLLLMILLATPALKLAFIGSRAPLTPRDVRAAFFFTLAGLGIAVVTIISNLSYAWLEARLDTQLASLSQRIRRNFADEVRRANDAVELFAAVRATKRAAEVQAPPEESAEASDDGYCRLPDYYRERTCRLRKCGLTSLFTAPLLRCPPYGDEAPRKPPNGAANAAAASLKRLEASISNTPPALCKRLGSESLECAWVCENLWGDDRPTGRAEGAAPHILACIGEVDPYLAMLVLTDDMGLQWEKWTPAPEVTSLISIADLQSFKDAKKRNMWTLEGGAEAVIHVQRSRNTAELIAMLSRRLSDDNGTLLGVATAVVELTSIRTPVLPPGFGAAVVQSDGEVVLHSQRQRSLYENFFSESTESQRIASAVAARHATFVESDYHARAHALYVHPIERSPWSLIVFRDKELPRTLDLNITATWLLLYLIYLGVVAGAWALAWALVRTDGEWVWPDVERARAYWIVVATLIALGLANLAVIVDGGDNSIGRLLVGTAAPFITMAILVLALAPPRAENGVSSAQARSRRRLRRVAWAVVVLGTLAVTLGCLLLSNCGTVSTLVVVLLAAAVQAAIAAPAAAATVFAWLRLTAALTAITVFLDGLRRHWRSAYVSAGVAAIIVVGVLPSIAIYKDAFDLGIATWMRHAKVAFAYGLAEREKRIRDRYGATVRPDQLEARLRMTWDMPDSDVSADARLAADTGRDETPRPESLGWRDSVEASIGDMLGVGSLCRTARWGDHCPLATRHVSGLLMASLPAYHPESGQLREMLFDRSSDGRWVSDDSSVTVQDPRLLTHRSGMRVQLAGGLPTWPIAPPVIPGGVLVLAGVMGLAGTYLLMWWYANQLFDLRHAGQYKSSDDGTWIASQGLFLVHPSARLRQGVERLLAATAAGTTPDGVTGVDLQRLEPQHAWRVLRPPPLTIVDHLEHEIDDGAHNRAKLEFLESLVLAHGARCVVLSTVDPLQHVRHRLQSPGDSADHHYVTVEEIDRWARVLDRLLKVSLPLGGTSAALEERVLRQIDAFRAPASTDSLHVTRTQWKGTVAEVAQSADAPGQRWAKVLTCECWWTPRLRGLAVEAARLFDPPDHPLACIRDIARWHHRTLWATLTDHQKLILIHLARHGFVNPRNWRALSRLMEEGLVQRAPAVRLMSESFTEFVKRAEAPKDVERWEAAAGPSAWHQIRGIVIAASVLAAVVLSQSQPELLTYLAGGLGAAAAFGMTVSNFLGFLQARRGGAGQSGSP